MFGPRWNGYTTEFAGTFEIARRLPGRAICSYRHESEVFNGEPFHPERSEQTSDMLGCGIRWDGKEK